jgi:hypothetical protein
MACLWSEETSWDALSVVDWVLGDCNQCARRQKVGCRWVDFEQRFTSLLLCRRRSISEANHSGHFQIESLPSHTICPWSTPPTASYSLPCHWCSSHEASRSTALKLSPTVGLNYRRISILMNKPVSTISDIANHPTTSPKRPDTKLLITPNRLHLILFVRMNADHRRITYSQLSHTLSYNCLHDTIRRALTQDNYSRFKVKSAPFITDVNQVRRLSYVDDSLQLPIFH